MSHSEFIKLMRLVIGSHQRNFLISLDMALASGGNIDLSFSFEGKSWGGLKAFSNLNLSTGMESLLLV